MSQALGRQLGSDRRVDDALVNAPLFHALVERLDDDERHVILDLGPPQSGTVALFSHFRCRLDIADLAANLPAMQRASEDDSPGETFAALLPPTHQEAADVILCWDLLNYLDRPGMKALMSELVKRGKPGTLVHALVVYSARMMPVLPNRYVPVDDHNLRLVSNSKETQAAPRYSPEDLSLCMPDYSLERAMLLRNGMQEFLFRL